jgi:transcription elongation GreA/GreB family factor
VKQLAEDRSEKPRAFPSDPGRIRRETRAEGRIGEAIEKAAAEADARVLRQQGYPPPSEAERALIAASPHEPVQLFSTVLVAELESGEQERFTIVPHDEADLAAGRLSIGSPIGRALYQEYPGAVVRVKTPAGPRLFRILQVQP